MIANESALGPKTGTLGGPLYCPKYPLKSIASIGHHAAVQRVQRGNHRLTLARRPVGPSPCPGAGRLKAMLAKFQASAKR